MVYCDIKEKREKSAIYLFGSKLDDITGEVEFYSNTDDMKVIKQPEKTEVGEKRLLMIILKYRELFKKGEFPKKLSFES